MDDSWVEYIQKDLGGFEKTKLLKGISFTEAVSKLACNSFKSTFFRAYNREVTLERVGDKLFVRKGGALRTLEINDVLADDWVER